MIPHAAYSVPEGSDLLDLSPPYSITVKIEADHKGYADHIFNNIEDAIRDQVVGKRPEGVK